MVARKLYDSSCEKIFSEISELFSPFIKIFISKMSKNHSNLNEIGTGRYIVVPSKELNDHDEVPTT